MKKLYRTKGRLFSREIGLMERLKYLWKIYVIRYHQEPKTIVLTKEECKALFHSQKYQWKKYWDGKKIPKKERFFKYRGVKVITK